MILGRYLLKTLAATVGAIWLALVLVMVAIELAEQAGLLTQYASVGTVLWLAADFAVIKAFQMLPFATFFGVLTVGALLAQRGELLAMAACGAPPWRLWAPVGVVVVATAALGTTLGELATPAAELGVTRLFQDELNKGPGRVSAFFTRRHAWYRIGERVLYLPRAEVLGDTVRFVSPVIYERTRGLVTRVIEGDLLVYQNSTWTMRQARIHDAALGTSETAASLPLPLGADADALVRTSGHPRQLATRDVLAVIERRRAAGFDTVAFVVELEDRFAHPWLGLWLLLVAAPWVFSPERRRSLAMALGGGVIALGLVLALGQVLRVLALSRIVPTSFGAFGMAAVALLLLPASWAIYQRQRAA
jgi:lipopolysaccharide export LptBFGC system permease protein LptF